MSADAIKFSVAVAAFAALVITGHPLAAPAAPALVPLTDEQKETARNVPYNDKPSDQICARCGESRGMHEGSLCPDYEGTFS